MRYYQYYSIWNGLSFSWQIIIIIAIVEQEKFG